MKELHSGHKCPASGIYQCFDEGDNAVATEGGMAREWTCVRNEPMPPAPQRGMHFQLVRRTIHEEPE